MIIENILAKRYATERITDIHSRRGSVLRERDLWIAVMKIQRELGVNIPAEDIQKFENAREEIDFELIDAIDAKINHDVKARIQAYIKAAGAGEYLHLAMTSRDLTDNVEQMQILDSMRVIRGKFVSLLRHWKDKSIEYQNIVLAARTHHQAAQPTLLGKRMSDYAQELLIHLPDFENMIDNYPLRGMKGPVGTQFDMLTLLGSDEKVEYLEKKVAELLGFKHVLHSVGQVYPRSLDYKILNTMSECGCAMTNFATTMRLMAGYELVTEGFKADQVGSSVMPHKMNTPHSERINGFGKLLKMYAMGAALNAGEQWEEGDVSCSVVRRVILPDAFFACDGLCETTLSVLNDMGAYPAIINEELERYLPFLATTEILSECVKAGIGRETAHSLIKRYAVQEALRMRKSGDKTNKFLDAFVSDDTIRTVGITAQTIDRVFRDKEHFIGNARKAIRSVSGEVQAIVDKYPQDAAYEPEPIR